MARFGMAPVQEVVPKKYQERPSQRAQLRAQYQQALQDAVNQQQALVVELEEGDKDMTIRARLRKAAEALGLEDIVIRRRGNQVIAYRPAEEEAPKVGTDDALGG